MKDGVKAVVAKDASAWRQWLSLHHTSEKRVWLIIYHKSSPTPSISYDEAVDEALCFGWVDSKPNKRDHESFYQYFSVRNPASNWSRINKEKIRKLQDAGKLAPSGLEMVLHAKETGTWDALNDVENLVIPEEMLALFSQNPTAKTHFENFPKSVKRGILEWIFNARRPATRQKRINETVELATRNIRANQYQR